MIAWPMCPSCRMLHPIKMAGAEQQWGIRCMCGYGFAVTLRVNRRGVVGRD